MGQHLPTLDVLNNACYSHLSSLHEEFLLCVSVKVGGDLVPYIRLEIVPLMLLNEEETLAERSTEPRRAMWHLQLTVTDVGALRQGQNFNIQYQL